MFFQQSVGFVALKPFSYPLNLLTLILVAACVVDMAGDSTALIIGFFWGGGGGEEGGCLSGSISCAIVASHALTSTLNPQPSTLNPCEMYPLLGFSFCTAEVMSCNISTSVELLAVDLQTPNRANFVEVMSCNIPTPVEL